MQIGITLQQVAQQARSKRNQKVFEIFRRRRRVLCSQLGKVECALERFGGVGKKVSGHKSGNTNAQQKTRNIQKTIEGKLRVQSRASDRLQDQVIELIKEREHKGTEEALARK